MEDIVILECSYSPSDYFEETEELPGEGYDVVIDDGKVTTRVKPDVYEQNPNLRQTLEDSIRSRFWGQQLVTNKPFELSKISVAHHFHADGRKDVTVFVPTARAVGRALAPDVIIKDQNGNVTYDSRQERIDKGKKLGQLIAEYYPLDPVLGSLLNSSKAAVDDRSNELVHLYEIRDALSKRFGGEAMAVSSLGISGKKWRRLGKLANDAPLKEGRHRGKFIGGLRNATQSELTEARTTACELIEGYLRYLERQSTD